MSAYESGWVAARQGYSLDEALRIWRDELGNTGTAEALRDGWHAYQSVTKPNVHELPACIDPMQRPGGVVVRIYRWRDGVILRERHLSVRDHLFAKTDPTLEMLAGIDNDDTWADPAKAGPEGHRAVVLIGYDGDDGTALAPPVLMTDDPTLTGWSPTNRP